jgi:hypothetical protein
MSNSANGSLYLSNVAVAFDQKGHQIHYGWGKTQEHPLLGDFDYIGVLYDTDMPDAVPDPMGNGYRIIDFDEELMPYIPTLVFSGQNIHIDNLYTVFVSSYDYSLPVPEAVYDKHPLWGNIPNQGATNGVFAVQVYPNPFTHTLTITVPETYRKEVLQLHLTDILGRTILHHKGTIQELNTYMAQHSSSLAAQQLYQLQLTHTGTQETVTHKIVKE